MIVPQFKVLVYPKVDNTSWGSAINITDLVDYQSGEGILVTTGTFQIALKNPEVGGVYPNSGLFDVDYLIKIYAWHGLVEPVDEEDKLIFDGVINEVSWENTDTTRRIVLQGTNVAEMMLKTMLPSAYTYDSSFNTAPKIIKNMLGFVNSYNNRKIYWHPSNPNTPTWGGYSFKEINWFQDYKPVFQQVADLSTNENTGVGDFYYYIKTEGGLTYLVWNKRNSDVADPVNDKLVEGKNINNVKVKRGVWDMVNALVLNCGRDANNKGILTFVFEQQSFGTIGGKWKYLVFKSGDELLVQEKEKKASSFVKDSNFPTSYPYTTYYTADFDDPYSNPVFTKGSTVTCTNDLQFNNFIRRAAKKKAKDTGLEIVKRYGLPRYRVTCSLPHGSISESIAGIGLELLPAKTVNVDIPTVGLNKNMRIKEVKHTLSFTGWNTDVDLEEDWKVI